MEENKIREKIEELTRQIALLPSGSIATKTINGKQYYYHRQVTDGKRKETYLSFEKVDVLREDIEKRKELEAERRKLKKMLLSEKSVRKKSPSHDFSILVRIGEQLARFAEPVRNYKHRECYPILREYVFGEQQDKVFVLYGLRRTGKTTLIRQVLLEMSSEKLEKTAFIQATSRDTLASVNKELQYLESKGFQHVFIDEVTLLEDFIDGAALFSDIYAASGMKIVLSGTDSLGFLFTKEEQLYDRCILLHTTFIPYREFESVLGMKGIDEYIRYGGTMSIGGNHYNEEFPFKDKASVDEYVDSAIARNIQHSLQYYQHGGHFRHLYDLYEKGELTSAINRVVEDMNHRFTKNVLTRTFSSGDLMISARNLLHERTSPVDLLENIDQEGVTIYLRTMLDILDKEEQTVEIDEVHAEQIEEYLTFLDLIKTVDLVYLPHGHRKDKITVISQPGIRFAQADALVKSLLQDEKFNSLSLVERKRILSRVQSEIKGRMMEEIVLLETQIANPDKQVFKLQFAIGEFDMVIHDPNKLTCEIFEMKYSKEVVPLQYRHLIDEKKCSDVEFYYGAIIGKFVIYRGEEAESNGIQYINVEKFLKQIEK